MRVVQHAMLIVKEQCSDSLVDNWDLSIKLLEISKSFPVFLFIFLHFSLALSLFSAYCTIEMSLEQELD